MSVLDRLEELERRVSQMVVRGTIAKVDHGRRRVVVLFDGDQLTDWLEWKPSRSGKVTVWSPPEVGEGVTIISDGDVNRGEVLPGSYHNGMPPPSTSPDEVVMLMPDGTRFTYDHKAHKLRIEVKGDVDLDVTGNVDAKASGGVSVESAADVSVNAQGSASVSCGGTCSVNGAKVSLGGGGAGVVTGKSICAYTGKPHGDCSKKVESA